MVRYLDAVCSRPTSVSCVAAKSQCRADQGMPLVGLQSYRVDDDDSISFPQIYADCNANLDFLAFLHVEWQRVMVSGDTSRPHPGS
jgi:hypothetical protein